MVKKKNNRNNNLMKIKLGSGKSSIKRKDVEIHGRDCIDDSAQ